MPRLSLYRPQKSSDYRFMDRTIKEMFQVGGTDLLVHKYLGTNNPKDSKDFTEPHYAETTATNIQDLLFLENRDRKYESSIYSIRGHYNVQNLDFDLSQFGLFLTSDVIFVTVHYNDMIDLIGRKLMVGDCFELPHLTDYHPLNDKIPVSLRRFYQVTDANYASEGFSQTWYPHLWRIKCEPLVDSQEFANILEEPINKDNYIGEWDEEMSYEVGYTVTFGGKIYTPIKPVPPGIDPTNKEYWTVSEEQNLIDIMSTYNKNIEINNAALKEAERQVPKSGYDNTNLYIVPTYIDGTPAPPIDVIKSSIGGPTLGTGTLTMVTSPEYSVSSPAIRFNNASSDLTIGAFDTLLLQVGQTLADVTDTMSGPVNGDTVLVVDQQPGNITGPYGTADNTFSTADQYVNFSATAVGSGANTTAIKVIVADKDVTAGLVIRATVFSDNGMPQSVWPAGTTITRVDYLEGIIFVSAPTRADVPGGTKLEISYDFTGVSKPVMDYRSDCDPRFQFIKHYTPRNFGYTAGYMTGDGKAPNGEPLTSGTSFPAAPTVGQYFLRLDYLPQKLFRYDGKRWVEISSNVRTEYGQGPGSGTLRSSFINDVNDRTPVAGGGTVPTRQSLSEALRIKPD
jgi:hypothetical protein